MVVFESSLPGRIPHGLRVSVLNHLPGTPSLVSVPCHLKEYAQSSVTCTCTDSCAFHVSYPRACLVSTACQQARSDRRLLRDHSLRSPRPTPAARAGSQQVETERASKRVQERRCGRGAVASVRPSVEMAACHYRTHFAANKHTLATCRWQTAHAHTHRDRV